MISEHYVSVVCLSGMFFYVACDTWFSVSLMRQMNVKGLPFLLLTAKQLVIN